MSNPYSVQSFVQAFMDNIFKIHGMPIVIISDRDRIFTSNLYKEIFRRMGVELRMSTAYHPQTDGQSERVNQCLEAYLRATVFQEPKHWMKWLPLAEFWYNTSYHTSLKLTPFEALYGYKPPQIGESAILNHNCPEEQLTSQDRTLILTNMKDNLNKAHQRMKHYADLHHSERTLDVGDMVYIKIQPYRQYAFGLRGSLKLRSKFYGPYQVLQRIGTRSYKLHLPEGVRMHPVFHVSQLKQHIGLNAVPLPHVPLVTEDGHIKTVPSAVLNRRVIQRNKLLVAQWLIQWEKLAPDDSTWEDVPFILHTFPGFSP